MSVRRWSVPEAGACLAGPLTEADEVAFVLPEGAGTVELRGIGDCVAPPVAGAVVLPVEGGFWMRLTPADGTVRMPVPRGLRFVLAQVPGAMPAPSFFPLSGLPEIQAAGADASDGMAEHLAALLRRGSGDAALAVVQRLGPAQAEAVMPDLLAMLADDPGDAPAHLLPFLALCSRGNARCA
ncbi:MAG: hypothetical protein KDK24_15030 [Pseudooceanicola sp.]|nr:hypothetical protein [Pseudooceanicola sp.]